MMDCYSLLPVRGSACPTRSSWSRWFILSRDTTVFSGWGKHGLLVELCGGICVSFGMSYVKWRFAPWTKEDRGVSFLGVGVVACIGTTSASVGVSEGLTEAISSLGDPGSFG